MRRSCSAFQLKPHSLSEVSNSKTFLTFSVLAQDGGNFGKPVALEPIALCTFSPISCSFQMMPEGVSLKCLSNCRPWPCRTAPNTLDPPFLRCHSHVHHFPVCIPPTTFILNGCLAILFGFGLLRVCTHSLFDVCVIGAFVRLRLPRRLGLGLTLTLTPFSIACAARQDLLGSLVRRSATEG